jgi:hypothetical protein
MPRMARTDLPTSGWGSGPPTFSPRPEVAAGPNRVVFPPTLTLHNKLRLGLQHKVEAEAVMNARNDADEDASSNEGDSLGPREAARLLERTQREAQRKLTSDKPVLSVSSALVVLAIYGSIWSSSRGHHPYTGPSLNVVGLVYILVAVAALVSVSVYLRATAGVTGRSRHEASTMAIPFVFAVVGVYVFDAALKYDGFSSSIVYGVFDAAAPWLVAGSVLAGHAAAKQDSWKVAGGVAMIVVAAGSAFAGPANVWGVLAVSGCLLLLAQGVVRVRSGRAGSIARPTATPSGLH